MEPKLKVGDFVQRFKGFRRWVGRRYEVLNVTLTDAYLQDIETKKCMNVPLRWISEDFIRVGKAPIDYGFQIATKGGV